MPPLWRRASPPPSSSFSHSFCTREDDNKDDDKDDDGEATPRRPARSFNVADIVAAESFRCTSGIECRCPIRALSSRRFQKASLTGAIRVKCFSARVPCTRARARCKQRKQKSANACSSRARLSESPRRPSTATRTRNAMHRRIGARTRGHTHIITARDDKARLRPSL